MFLGQVNGFDAIKRRLFGEVAQIDCERGAEAEFVFRRRDAIAEEQLSGHAHVGAVFVEVALGEPARLCVTLELVDLDAALKK